MSDLERGIVSNGALSFPYVNSTSMTAIQGPDKPQPEVYSEGKETSLATSSEKVECLGTPVSVNDHGTTLSYENVADALAEISRTTLSRNIVTLKSLHYQNIAYLESKIMKHSLIQKAAESKVCNRLFEPCEIFHTFSQRIPAYRPSANRREA